MLERSGDADFAIEALDVDAAGQLSGQHFDDDFASERGVIGYEDVAHPTAADFALERIAVAERGLDPVAEWGRHDGLILS